QPGDALLVQPAHHLDAAAPHAATVPADADELARAVPDLSRARGRLPRREPAAACDERAAVVDAAAPAGASRRLARRRAVRRASGRGGCGRLGVATRCAAVRRAMPCGGDHLLPILRAE